MPPEAGHCASRYGNRLLREAGVALRLPERAEVDPALRWAQCGAMALSGEPDGSPQVCPVPLAAYADGILAALRALQPRAGFVEVE
jgi:hypothetical protein